MDNIYGGGIVGLVVLIILIIVLLRLIWRRCYHPIGSVRFGPCGGKNCQLSKKGSRK